MYKTLIRSLTFLALITCGSVVHATPMTYQYTSGVLTPIAGGPTVTSMSLLFTADLVGGLITSDQRLAVSAWTISDGFTTVSESSSNFVLTEFLLSTDALGVIADVVFSVGRPPGVFDTLSLGDLSALSLRARGPSARVPPTDPDAPHGVFTEGASAEYCDAVRPAGFDRKSDLAFPARCVRVGVARAFGPVSGAVVAAPVPAPATLALCALDSLVSA